MIEDRVKHLYFRAEELRAMADGLQAQEVRQSLLSMANAFDWLAEKEDEWRKRDDAPHD